MKKINLFFTYASLISILIFRNAGLYTFFGPTARILLLIIVFSRPLEDILCLTKIGPYFSKIVHIRQGLGIMTGIFSIAHAIGYFMSIKFSFVDLFSNGTVWQLNNIIGSGLRAMIFMLPPLITSNTFSMTNFGKHWKTIQRFTYPAFVLTAFHVGISKGNIPVSIAIILLYTTIRILAYKKIKLKFAFK